MSDAGTQDRVLHLNAFIFDIGHHEAARRLPESDPLATTDIEHYIRTAQLAEAAGFDSIFFQDVPAILGDARHRALAMLEPLTLVAALAVVTQRIGLIATASTTYNSPYNLARRFASLDHISHGRIGWNIVTSADDDAARNFGLDGQRLHQDRYDRADDVLEAVTKLWDSWEDDARIADQAAGVFADTSKIRAVDHEGPYHRTAGPLDVPRGPQGHPVRVQAGSSEAGRAFAARWAEAVFTVQRSLEEAQDFYADVKARAVAAGRAPDQIKILPGIVPFLGSTEAEAVAREQQFTDRLVPAYGLRMLSKFFETDLTGLDLDGPLPDLPPEHDIHGHKTRSTLVAELARREQLTVRQLLAKLGGGRGHRTWVGTPEQLADDLELWFREGGADGFNIMAPAIPVDLQVFADEVIPILRRRGLVPEEYRGATLREHYGLERPANRLAGAAMPSAI